MRNETNPRDMRSRRVLLLSVFTFFSFVLFAQVKISGKITSASDQGIPDISVAVRGTNFGTVSDAQGNYSFQANLNPGNYELQFSGVGFRQVTQTIHINGNGNYTADDRLSEDALKMDEV